MTLNSVSLFGSTVDWNAGATYGIFIVLIVLMLGGIIALLFMLLSSIKTQRIEVYHEEVSKEEEDEEYAAIASAVHELELPDEESYRAGRLTYDRSFTAKFIQSDDETKQYYTKLKNSLMSYKKIHSRMSWKRETFRSGMKVVARLAFRGKTLCLYLPLDPSQFVESKYHVEDVSNLAMYADTPCAYRINNERRTQYAAELIEMVMTAYNVPKVEEKSDDYYMPYEGLVELIDKGLIRRVVRESTDEFSFSTKTANS